MLIEPDCGLSDWRDCHSVNAGGGLEMLEWQDGIMSGWLARGKDGQWAARTCGGSVPRQNGKTLGLVVPRINYGMIVLGEQVLYTSHLQKTSTETFESIASFFDTKPMRKYVKDIKTALGRESVVLKNGGRIKFLARTRNGGRGQHGDLLVFDEALELDADSQASFLPAISASRNPQTIYISTPPTAKSDGSVFRSLRDRAMGGQKGVAWFEWSVDEIGDIHDKARWYATNPSLGILINEATVEAEAAQMDTDTFARERLGWWPKKAVADHVLDEDAWNACAEKNPRKEGIVVYAVKFSPCGSVGSLAACYKPEEGKPFVYIVDSRSLSSGLAWFADFLADKEDEAAQIVVDGQSNAQALIERLLDAGVSPKTIIRPKTADVIAANATLANAVMERSMCHFAQPALDASATKTTRRRIGHDGGWGFASTDEADASLIEAAALALWSAQTTKRDPERRAVVF